MQLRAAVLKNAERARNAGGRLPARLGRFIAGHELVDANHVQLKLAAWLREDGKVIIVFVSVVWLVEDIDVVVIWQKASRRN
jgi:hypothetical protein